MHRIQQIFVTRKKSTARSTSKPNPNSTPKLERQNAVNSFDFDLPSTSSSFSSWDDHLSSASASSSAAQRIPCVDISSLNERTSFRIEGKCSDEFDVICRSLGLSGAEDFSIPAVEWEEMKVRSSSDDDAFPRISRFNFVFDGGGGGGSDDVINSKNETPGLVYSDVASFKSERINNGEVIQKIEYTAYPSAPIMVSSEGLHKYQEVVTSGVGSGNRLGDSLRGTQLILNKNEPFDLLDLGESRKLSTEGEITSDLVSSVLERFDEFGSTGNIDNALRSTPDILRLFVSEDDQKLPRSEVCEEVSYEDEEDGGMDEVKEEKVDEEEAHNVVARRSGGEDGLLLESYLRKTLSNDDDPSRTTTKHMWNVSPNGKFKRIITYWEKGELLGRGSFGSVYEGIADNGFFFAVKEVSLLDQGEEGRQSLYQLEQEIALLSQFEHDNIVRYYGTDKDESKLYIFLELVTKGSILSLYQKYHLQDSQVSAYTRQILHGLKYLHDRNVVHRDIKCANILVDASGSVKLADFGLAKATRRNDVKSFKGTALWMAPEVVNRKNQGYGLPADIWSLGCTVLEMLTRQFPYSHLENPWQALYKIGKGEPPPVPQSLSRDARGFIFECLQVNPSARPTAAQLLDHAFVKKPFRLSGSASPYHPRHLLTIL